MRHTDQTHLHAGTQDLAEEEIRDELRPIASCPVSAAAEKAMRQQLVTASRRREQDR